MKCLKLLLLLITFVFSSHIFSQNIEGYVVDESNEPLAFCTIGIVGQDIGTVSNLRGYFALEVPKEFSYDSITFSYVGYSEQKLSVSEAKNRKDLRIILKENMISLEEVVVKSEKSKQIEFGYKKDTEIFLWMGGHGDGAEVATYISPKKKVLLDEISVQIENKEGEAFQLLLNIYELDPQTKQPGKQLLKERTLISSSKKEGRITVDISNQNIEVEKPFFVSLKWVDISKKTPFLGMNFTNDKAFLRTVALGEWRVYLNANIKVTGTIVK